MSSKKKFIIFILIFSSVFFAFSEEIVEAIVAIVNDDIITLSQYKAQHDMFYQVLRSQFQGEDFDKQYNQLKANLLDTMITELLLLQEAGKKDLDVSDQLNMYIENIKKENNIQTDEQLRQAMRQQGVNFDAWKKQQEDNFLKQAVLFMEVNRSIVIDDSEIVSYYKQHPEEFTELPEYRLRVISLSTDQKNDDELRAKQKEIDDRLAAGEEFAFLAGQYSEGPEKESQGDLGTFKKGELAKTLEQAVERLNIGQLSSWIQSETGWYLIRLEEKKESRLRTFEDVREEIETKLSEEQSQEKQKEYLDRIRKGSFIKILIPNPIER